MTFLQLLWFLIVFILFAVFFFLEGFDFGIGMASRFIAKDINQRKALLSTIGPHWDGNEVWLITAGGAMFASFPMWYASLFSGYYVMFVLTLLALIFRGVSFEFAENAQSDFGVNMWQWATFFGSMFAPLFLGIIFTSLIQGVPMDRAGNIYLSIGDVLNPLSIIGGVAVVLLCLMHGLNYARLTTTGYLRTRAHQLVMKLYALLVPGVVIFALLVGFYTDFLKRRPLSTTTIVILIVLLVIYGIYTTVKNNEVGSLLATGFILVSIVGLIFNGLFPRVMIAKKAANSLLIQNASASNLTLIIMTIVVVVLLPIVIGYVIWSYKLFTKRVASPAKG